MKTLFGEHIQFESDEEFKIFFETIDKESLIQLLESALNYSSRLGIFNLEESYYIYKSLEKLKQI